MNSANVKKGAAAVVVAGASLLAFIGNWEGSRDDVYLDIVGVPTVCNGHTGSDVKVGDVWTKEQCDAVLHKDVSRHGQAVLRCIHVPLNQNQYDAFAALTYNIGEGAFCTSTLVKVANAGDIAAACQQILRWNRAGGRVVKGLANRRQAEYERCVRPVTPSAPAANDPNVKAAA